MHIFFFCSFISNRDADTDRMRGFCCSPVFISEAGPVGPHSELAEELSEPLLDLAALLSAFIPAGTLSTSEAVAVINSRVVKA